MKILKSTKFNLQDYRRGYKYEMKNMEALSYEKMFKKRIYKYGKPKLEENKDWLKISNKIFYKKDSILRLAQECKNKNRK